MLNKKAIALRELAWWLIGVAVLVLVALGIWILSAKNQNAIAIISDLFRFRRVA